MQPPLRFAQRVDLGKVYVWKSFQTFTLDKKALYLLFCSWFAPQRGGICYFTRFGGLRFCFSRLKTSFSQTWKCAPDSEPNFWTKGDPTLSSAALCRCFSTYRVVYWVSRWFSMFLFKFPGQTVVTRWFRWICFWCCFLLLWRWVSTKFHGMWIFVQNRRAKRRIGNFIGRVPLWPHQRLSSTRGIVTGRPATVLSPFSFSFSPLEGGKAVRFFLVVFFVYGLASFVVLLPFSFS